MRIISITYKTVGKQGVLAFVFLLFLTISFNSAVLAQTTDSLAASESAAVANSDDGPSLQNLSKTTSAVNEKLKADARWKEILGYIQMVVGFIITIGLAWFLASWARKKELAKEKEKAERVEKALQKKTPGSQRRR